MGSVGEFIFGLFGKAETASKGRGTYRFVKNASWAHYHALGLCAWHET